ncbi:hypothetical protein HN51_040173 [Arachis hypogaea]
MADARPRADISTDVSFSCHLESSRLKLTQLEQELQRARQQGIFISSSGDQAYSMSKNGIILYKTMSFIPQISISGCFYK